MAVSKTVQIRLSAEAQEVVSALNSVSKNLVHFGNSAQQMGHRLGTVFNPLMKIVAGVSAGLIAAASSITAASLSIGGSFEDSMLKVKGVTGATGEEFDRLTARARLIGADLPVSAQAAADAMYSMASAGMEVGEILDSVNSVVALSVSQGYDLAASADLMMSTLSSFNLESEDASRVADVFSNAISSSQLNMEKLAYAMRYAGPVANSLGVTLERTVAAMQALADAGLKGEQIGTYLRGIMTAIIDPSTRAKIRLDELGVSVRDSNGKLRDFTDVLRGLQAAGAAGEDFVTLFGRELSAAGAILVSAADDLEMFEEGLRKAGRTQELLEEQMKGFRNMVISMKSAIQENFLVVFDGIKDRAKDVVSSLRELAKAFSEWSAETDVIGKSIGAFFEGFGVGIPAVENFRKTLLSIDVQAVAQRFRDLGEGVKALFDSFKSIAEKVPWKALAEHLDTITGVIVVGWAAGKVALITGGVAGLAKAFRALADAVKGVAIAEAAAGGAGILSSIKYLAPSLAGFATAGATAVSFLLAFPDKLDDSTEGLDRMRAALEGNREAFESLPGEIQEFMKTAYDIDGLIDQAEDAAKAGESLKALSREMGDTLRNVFDVYSDHGRAASAVMRMFGDSIRQYLVLAGVEGADKLRDSFKALGPEVGSVVEDVLARVLAEMTQGVERLAALPGEMGATVRSIVAAYDDQGKAASRIMRQYGEDIRRFLAEAGVDGVKQIQEAFRELGEDVAAVMEDVVSKVQGAMSEASKSSGEKESYAGSVGLAMKQAVMEFSVYAADLVNRTKQLKDEFGLSGEEAGAALEEQLSAKIREVADNLVGEFDNPALRTILRDTFASLAEQSGGSFYRNLKGYLDQALGLTRDAVRSLDDQLQGAIGQAQAKFGGQWEVGTVISEDENRKVVQITNGVVYLAQELQKAKTETQNMGFESLVRSLKDIKGQISEAFSPENINMSGMTADVSSALQSLSSPAKSAGMQIGDGLYGGIMQGVNRAVQEAQSALSKIKVQGIQTTGFGLTDAMRSDL